MRKILFRGKSDPIQEINDNSWYEGYLLRVHEDYKIILWNGRLQMDVIPETIGQYTGRKDKNGKKIFEGDILNFEYDGEISKYVVYFSEAVNAFLLKMNGDTKCEPDFMDDWERDEWKIIGNIYDNPELIGGEQNG